MNVRLGIIHLRQSYGFFRRAERVPRVRVLELHDRSNVPRPECGHACPDFAVKLVNLPNLLSAPPAGVVKFTAEFHCPRIDSEKAQFSELRFTHRFEYI